MAKKFVFSVANDDLERVHTTAGSVVAPLLGVKT